MVSEEFGNIQDHFFVMASRIPFGLFKFESRVINKTNFASINYQPDYNDLTNQQCLTATINRTSKQLDMQIADCFEKNLIFCRKLYFAEPNCSEWSSFTNVSFHSLLLNPALKLNYKQAIAYKRAEIMEVISRTDMSKIHMSLLQSLWYAFIPCFDERNISMFVHDMSLVRYCEWRGIPLPCSAIVSTFPTDQGLCCSFNMKAADDIYVESKFLSILQEMQNTDMVNSFKSSYLQTPFSESNGAKAGRTKGLMVLLDAHSNWLVPGSFDEDYHAFSAVIQSSGNFPLMSQGGLSIRPGYNNIITLTSSELDADDNIRSLKKEERNCLFREENSGLILHKQYSYLNCKFECILSYAKTEVFKLHGFECQPWFFPPPNDSAIICDPWAANKFFRIMNKEIPDSQCTHCLPECGSTFFVNNYSGAFL